MDICVHIPHMYIYRHKMHSLSLSLKTIVIYSPLEHECTGKNIYNGYTYYGFRVDRLRSPYAPLIPVAGCPSQLWPSILASLFARLVEFQVACSYMLIRMLDAAEWIAPKFTTIPNSQPSHSMFKTFFCHLRMTLLGMEGFEPIAWKGVALAVCQRTATNATVWQCENPRKQNHPSQTLSKIQK